jgi:predicted PolB exonuclease-like 3'-5' exonuclease
MAENAAVRDNEVVFMSLATRAAQNGSNFYDEKARNMIGISERFCFKSRLQKRW